MKTQMKTQTHVEPGDKAYPALSGLDFWHYLGSLAASVYFNRPEADQRG